MEKQLCTYAIAEILREESDEDHAIRSSEIIERLEQQYEMKIGRHKLYSTIQQLRMLGEDIVYDPHSKGYYMASRQLTKGEVFIGLYDALLDDSFLDVEWKYWFFEKAESNHNTTCIMNAQKLLTLNCYTEISYRVELLSLLKTKGKVDKFDKEMDETVHRNITEVAPEVAKLLQNTSASECEQVLQSLSLNQ